MLAAAYTGKIVPITALLKDTRFCPKDLILRSSFG